MHRNAMSPKEQGYALLAAGRPAEALGYLLEALAGEPHEALLRHSLALTYAALRKPEVALAEEREAVALEPGCVDYRMALGHMLESRGDWPGALAQYRAAAEADPQATEPRDALTALATEFYARGMLEFDKGNSAAAASLFAIVLRIDEDHARAKQQMAQLAVASVQPVQRGTRNGWRRIAVGAAALGVGLVLSLAFLVPFLIRASLDTYQEEDVSGREESVAQQPAVVPQLSAEQLAIQREIEVVDQLCRRDYCWYCRFIGLPTSSSEAVMLLDLSSQYGIDTAEIVARHLDRHDKGQCSRRHPP